MVLPFSVSRKMSAKSLSKDVSDKSNSSSEDSSFDGSTSSEGNSDCENVESEAENSEVELDFEGYPILDGDYHAIKTFIQDLLLESNVDCSAVTEVIVHPSTIGCSIKSASSDDDEDDEDDEDDKAIKQEEGEDDKAEEDLFGISCLIHLNKYKEEPFCKDLKSLLIEKANSCGMKKDMIQILSKQVYWLVHERFPGIPSGITPPTMNSLLDEIREKANQFDHILIITKGYDINSKLEHIPSAKKARNCLPEDITFHYPEMNLFYKESTCSCVWSVTEERVGEEDEELKPLRIAMIFDCHKFEPFVKTLDLNL